jgi:hypothetical protein
MDDFGGNMTVRNSAARIVAAAGIVSATAVALTAGSAYANTGPDHPPTPPAHTMGHHPGPPAHTVSHHPGLPAHTTSHHPGPPAHTASHHPAVHHGPVTRLTTRTRDARIRLSPTADRHGRTLSTLRRPGSPVAVTCWTTGARVGGSTVWFQTVAPARGYISSSEVGRPAHPVGRCH